jgi:hypothetical protein
VRKKIQVTMSSATHHHLNTLCYVYGVAASELVAGLLQGAYERVRDDAQKLKDEVEAKRAAEVDA